MRLLRVLLLVVVAIACAYCTAYDRAQYNALIDAQSDGADVLLDARLDGTLDAPRDGVATDGDDVAADAQCAACASPRTCCGGACADTQFDPRNCGACGHVCLGTTCSGATCTSVCRVGFLDCDNNVVNGCEVDAAVDSNNCGSCGRACPTGRVCGAGTCVCAAGTADCDGNPGNGCEVPTDADVLNCGACNHACGAGQTCTMGGCVCDPQHGDCDGMPSNGCEVDLQSDPVHCGACATACGANATCAAGACGCNAGYLRCPSTARDCVTPLNDPDNCGACGVACGGETPFCSATGCVLSCPTGQRPCGEACADLQTDATNCGACGAACPSRPNAVASCAAGVCDSRCAAGFGDCDGVATNGCETDLRASNSNCGVCGTACSGTQICSSGACTCPAGLRDCGSGRCAACCGDTDCSDGDSCTVDSCVSGTCQRTGCSAGTVCCGGLACQSCCSNADCAGAGGNRGCSGTGTCTVCLPGFADCDGNTGNGCETATSNSITNCGACGTACSYTNAAAQCVGGVCALGACLPGFADCDGNAANGCEANLNSDASNCGRCGGGCVAPTNTCSAGTCVVPVCPAGRGDCDGNAGNGCETDLATSSANCGACGTGCSFANGSGACTNTTCTLSNCNAGYGNCDGSSANGCETNLNVTVSRCGSCTNACSFANASAVCNAGACALSTCTSGYANCDGSAANGCEIRTSNDVTHCGSCTTACASGANSTATCTTGLCGLACSAGYADCDRVASTGCEVNVLSSASNCGTCGRACALGEVCSNGACIIPAASFQITALSSSGCATQDHASNTGFDRGGLVVSSARVFYDGNSGTGLFDLLSFANPTTVVSYDALVSDLHTGRVFALGTRMHGAIDIGGGVVNALLEINPSTGALTGAAISLSVQINLGTTSGFFSGWDRVVVHNGSRAYSISLTGVVTDLGAMSTPAHIACAGWGYWGVAETFGGALYLTYVRNSTSIVRTRVPDGATTTIGTFTNLGNTCAIAFSPTRSRWYFHHSGASQFATGTQIDGYCPGTWAAPDTGCPAGTSTCAGSCHYVASDDSNCGACGTACASGTACISSSCGVSCPSGQSLCGGVCRDTQSDINNCGGCGVVCPAVPNGSPYCSSGICYRSCNGNYADCNGLAADGCEINVGSSATNCGYCGHACGTGTSCCSATCRDTSSDRSNCGACGTTCASSQYCGNSTCVCPLMCGLSCVDPLTDASNCGACGVACATGTICSNGTCRAPITTYTTSTSPLAYIDACAQAVHSEYLGTTDDSYATVSLPFAFQFYDAAHREAWFSTNGVVGFASPTSNYSNTCLPAGIGTVIYAYWDDLYIRARMCTATTGTAPNRRWVLTWDDARLYADANSHITMSVVLSETANTVDLFYPTVSGLGSSATIGVENVGVGSTQFSCNTASLANGTSIRFTGM